MNAAEDLEEVLTLEQAQELAGLDSGAAVGGGSPTQRLLDDLLGRLEDDDSLMFLR
jgi:hypothetical protein